MTPQTSPSALHSSWRTLRRLLVLLAGTAVLVAGLVMVVLPGPATLIMPLGLAILGTEFPWARRTLEQVRAFLHHWLGRWLRRKSNAAVHGAVFKGEAR